MYFFITVKGFLKIFSIFFVGLLPYPLTSLILYHKPIEKSILFLKKVFVKLHKFRETNQLQVYAICLLTFCVPCDIMEIRPAANVCGPLSLCTNCTKRKEVGGFPPPLVVYQLIFHHFHPFLSYACGSRGGLTTNPRLSRAFCKVS